MSISVLNRLDKMEKGGLINGNEYIIIKNKKQKTLYTGIINSIPLSVLRNDTFSIAQYSKSEKTILSDSSQYYYTVEIVTDF